MPLIFVLENGLGLASNSFYVSVFFFFVKQGPGNEKEVKTKKVFSVFFVSLCFCFFAILETFFSDEDFLVKLLFFFFLAAQNQ